MILFRCFAWNEAGSRDERDGPLWFPREFQGEGRHDNPDLYGCLYLADRAVSSVVEQLARFRGQRLTPALLRRRGLPLALAELELPAGSELVDLDDPIVLRREKLRPSVVATREREITQPQARALHAKHTGAAGLRWWSTYESLWMHVTLFDRAARDLRLKEVRALTIDDAAVAEAAQRFAMQVR
ncbi:MAG: RES domain-containing protein [Vicinamibacterales bacterium]